MEVFIKIEALDDRTVLKILKAARKKIKKRFKTQPEGGEIEIDGVHLDVHIHGR